jgi:N-acetyltransferase
MTAAPPAVPLLAGHRVRLEPLSCDHVDDLAVAAGGDRASFAWAAVPTSDAVADFVAGRLATRDRGEAVPFAQVAVANGRAVGATSYLNVRRRPGDELPYAVEVGGTWLAASSQRTGINVEAKLLLLTHAFESWGVGRVDIKTDARNERARAAIAALGATCEGVLRGWQPSQAPGEEHLLRDSAMYAVVAAEWPAVRAHLERRLAVARS